MVILPTIHGDPVHPLGGVIDAKLSWLFLGCWPADVACSCNRLLFSFSRRCAIGAVGNASVIESFHNRVEAIFW